MSGESKRFLSLILLLLIALTLAFIWGNSMLDRESSAQVSGGLLEWLGPVLDFIGIQTEDDHWLRKLAHFCEFALLGFELCLLFILRDKAGKSAFFAALAASFFVAAVDEGIQFFSGRYAHILDVLLDFSGALSGAALLLCMFVLIRGRKT